MSRLRTARRILLLALLAAALATLWWERETRLPVLPTGSPPVTLTVTRGMTVAEIAEQLHALGVVRYPLVFRVLVVRRGAATGLKAGEYRLAASLSPEEIVGVLLRGEVVRRRVTFPEGKAIDEMATIAQEAGGVPSASFLEAARDPARIRDLDPKAADLEGYLFPDTYDVPRVEDAGAALVARMVNRFRKIVGPSLTDLQSRQLTLREAVTLASLVELETARAEERPRIAAVFLNRLKKKMPLQSDPTVIFALRRAGHYDGNIHKQDLSTSSPYNTYRVAGLPPGPIASPGRASFEAVLHPAPVEDLYFVSRNDGSHEFNVSLRDHERAVDRYQRHRTGASGG